MAHWYDSSQPKQPLWHLFRLFSVQYSPEGAPASGHCAYSAFIMQASSSLQLPAQGDPASTGGAVHVTWIMSVQLAPSARHSVNKQVSHHPNIKRASGSTHCCCCLQTKGRHHMQVVIGRYQHC